MTEPTDTITIRVPQALKNKLVQMSEKNQLNLNLLINQILTKNMQWDEHVTKMGWLQFDPSVVREIFSHLNNSQIDEIVNVIKGDIRNGVEFIYGETSLQNIVGFIDTWLRSTSIPFRHIEDEISHQFLVNHSLGENWSTFATKTTKEFVTEVGYKVSEVSANTDSYSFKILK